VPGPEGPGGDPRVHLRASRLARVRSRHVDRRIRQHTFRETVRPQPGRSARTAARHRRIAATHRRHDPPPGRPGRRGHSSLPALQHAGEHVRNPGETPRVLRALPPHGDLRRDPAAQAGAGDLSAPGGENRHRAGRKRVHRRPAAQRRRGARVRPARHPVHQPRSLSHGIAWLSTASQSLTEGAAMSPTRRNFMQQSLAVAATLPAALAAAEQAPATKPWLEAGDLVAKMNWLNPPASVTYGAGTVTAKTRGHTDFWRKTFYGYITDNGHFFHLPMFGEFVFQARIGGEYTSLYDQAGIMVRLDEKHWMK